MKKLFLALALTSAATGAMASATADKFDSKLYESCNQRSVAAVTAAMVIGKGQSFDAFAAHYKDATLDKHLAMVAFNALQYDFKDADSDRLVLLQNFLAGICYKTTRQ